MRRKANAYDNHDPTVLVIGGAQSGLSIAARLNPSYSPPNAFVTDEVRSGG
jgi:hypothetical protein